MSGQSHRTGRATRRQRSSHTPCRRIPFLSDELREFVPQVQTQELGKVDRKKSVSQRYLSGVWGSVNGSPFELFRRQGRNAEEHAAQARAPFEPAAPGSALACAACSW